MKQDRRFKAYRVNVDEEELLRGAFCSYKDTFAGIQVARRTEKTLREEKRKYRAKTVRLAQKLRQRGYTYERIGTLLGKAGQNAKQIGKMYCKQK